MEHRRARRQPEPGRQLAGRRLCARQLHPGLVLVAARADFFVQVADVQLRGDPRQVRGEGAHALHTLDQAFGAKWLLDLTASYAVNGWEFSIGGDNVLDEYPDEVIFANTNSGQLPYPSQSPFGFNGAYVYGRVAYKW